MLSFSGFRLEDGSPIYQQIIRYLEQGIAAGTIRDGDGLPSRRVLSAQLGVNPNTVQKACRMLEEAGLITSRSGPRANLPWTRRLWPPSAPRLDGAGGRRPGPLPAADGPHPTRAEALIDPAVGQPGTGGGEAMKRIASLLMLAARSTLWKAAGITLASCLTEAGLFLAALSGWQDTVRTAYYEYSNPMGLEGLLMQYPLSWCFRIGLVLVCAVLAFLGWEGSSRVSYTLRRLSVGHRALTLLWAGYGFFCLLFFWAAHLGTLLALCAAALPRLAPEFSGPQALFLACYRDPYLHSLLPLDDCLLWVRNLSMCAALGTAAASFSFQRRMGRRAFAILPLAALSALCFPLPMGLL